MTTFLHTIRSRNKTLDRRLTKEYWLAKFNSIFTSIKIGFIEKQLSRHIEKTLNCIDDATNLLFNAYLEANEIDSKEAEKIYPDIVSIRKKIYKQNKQFESINYADEVRLKNKFQKLIRLTNRLEARLHKKSLKYSPPIETPSYVKDKMASNSKIILGNALFEEANH